MPNQEIGVDSIFETRQFTAGLGRYLAGLNNAVRETGVAVTAINAFGAQTTTALNAILGQATGTAQAIAAVTASIRAASAASAAAAATASAPAPSSQGAASLTDLLAQTRLINEEVRDRIALENLVTQAQDRQLTSLQQIKNANEQNRLSVLRDLRDQEAAQVQLNQAQLDAIRNEATTPRDTGKGARQELEDQLRLAALLQQSFQARIAEERTKRTLQEQNLSILAREKALIEQGTQALQAQKREQEALNISAAAAARVRRANIIPVTDQDLGVKGRDPLDDQLRVQRLIAEELRGQIKIKQAQVALDDQGSSALKRKQAEIEKETQLLEQQKREREITLSGGNLAQLEAARKINVTLQDLGEKQRDTLQNQLTLQGLLGAEIRDRIGEEQARLTLMSRQSTELQKQQATLQLQTIAANRQQRTATAATLNVPGSTNAIANIRNTTVATRDLNSEVKKATVSMNAMSASSAALAVTVGNLAAGAIRSAITGFIGMGKTILEQVTFFERMDLSVQFFAARSAIAEDATLSFEQALAQTTEQSQALSFWLQQLAVQSPFTTRDVSTIFRTAQAYGLTRQEAELLTPLLLDFASASGLTSDVLERLALAFGQVRSRGKLTGEEVRQLGNSGLPIRDILVKALGIANEEFDELLESGALTSDVVLPAIVEAMKVFEGQAERISFGSIGGIISAFDELQEITTATFFRGVLAPLIDDFKEFFSVVNQPTTLAFVKLLGEELGGNLENAVHGLGAGIRALTVDWQELDPVVKQQILTFGAAFAIAIALAGAIGLLTVAFGLLTNPIVVAATVFAFFVSEYSSGFAMLDSITGGFISLMTSLPSKIGRGITATIAVVGKGTKAVGDLFRGLQRQLGEFGADAVTAFGEGAIGAVNALLPVFGLISGLFSFWLAPGSPPRVAPNIDKWGASTIDEYGAGMDADSLNAPMQRIGKYINTSLNSLEPEFKTAGFQSMLEYGKGIVDADFVGPLTKGGSRVANQMFKAVDQAAKEADFGSIGVAVSQEFVDGFIKTLPVLIPQMDAELKQILDRIGSGRQLSAAGAFAMNDYLDGFKLADFSILDSATSVVQDVLQSLVDLGELDELDMQRILFGSSENIAKAIEEFREIGHITDDTLNQVSQSAGQAGRFVVQLLGDYTKLSVATDAVNEAQEKLNAVTEHYSDILKPLQAQLDKLNEKVQVADEEERILSLRRIIANEAVSSRRKQNASDQIQQILAERRVRTLGQERDAAVEAGEDTLKAREKERDALQESFDILKARIDAQLAQLGLVAQEGSIQRDLQEEALKLREKQKTELELQQELLRLQNEEMGDLVKAAKAKLVLDDSTSSEYERQQALLDLQEVAISRRNRLLEAAKFGIPEGELTKIRDLIPTMDDLGIKEGKQKFESDMSAITEGLVDVKDITQQIEEATEKVRVKWAETKAEITATFVEMNSNLPDFLKFFPEDNGEIPIIGTLEKVGIAIAGLAGIIVVKNILGLLTALRAVLGFGAVAGGAAGATGGFGIAGAASAAASAFGTFLLVVEGALAAIPPITAVLLAMYGAANLLANAFDRLQKYDFGKTAIDVATPVDLPNFDSAGKPSEMFGGDVLPEGWVPDWLKNLFGDGGASAAPTPVDLEPYQNALRGTIATIVKNGVESGITDADIKTQVGMAFNNGIAAGLVIDDASLRAQANDYMIQLLQLYKDAGEIDSPSALTSRELGEPLGDGIPLGITRSLENGGNRSIIATALHAMLASVTAAAEGLRQKLFTEFSASRKNTLADSEAIKTGVIFDFATLNTKVTTGSAALVAQMAVDWAAMRLDSTTQSEAIQTETLADFTTLNTSLVTGMSAIYATVVNSFTLMKTDSLLAVGELRTEVASMLVGAKDSLLADINLGLLGKDNLVPATMGAQFMVSLGDGILAGKENLASAMTEAFSYALTVSGAALPSKMTPLIQTSGLTPQQSPNPPAGSAGGSRTNVYQLTVLTAAQSQGVIADYGIMQTLTGY